MSRDSDGSDKPSRQSASVVDIALAASTPALLRAQELIYDAWETADPMERVSMAKQALKLSPDCADAYSLLAEETAQTSHEALKLYVDAAAAAQRTLDPSVFKDDLGHFWGLIETRPFMRAQQGIADCLMEAGRFVEAVDVLQQMLELNTSDSQGMRYLLMSVLFELDDVAARDGLFQRFATESSAFWAYSKALHALREPAGEAGAMNELQRARRSNHFIADVLLGLRPIMTGPAQFYGDGDQGDAAYYLELCMHHWLRTPGAIEALRTVAKPAVRRS